MTGSPLARQGELPKGIQLLNHAPDRAQFPLKAVGSNGADRRHIGHRVSVM